MSIATVHFQLNIIQFHKKLLKYFSTGVYFKMLHDTQSCVYDTLFLCLSTVFFYNAMKFFVFSIDVYIFK